MTDLHYEFTGETKVNWAGVTLHRIRATRDMPRFFVSAGEEGGWIEDTKNLSGDAWVFGDARVFGDADYMHLTTYTSQKLLTTLFKEKNGKHTIRMGCWAGTVDELEALFKRDEWVETSGDDAHEARQEMLALCQMFRARIARWGNDSED